jgi:tetratricopeptide (TPR) repeat protein
MYRIRFFFVLAVSAACSSTLYAADGRVVPRGGRHFPAAASDAIEKDISDASAAIQADPKNAKPYLARGKAYLTHAQLDRALADFDAAIKLDPTDAEAYQVRATARQQRRELVDQAIDDLTMVIRLRPNDATAYGDRGRLYLQQEDVLESFSDYVSAAKIDPEEGNLRNQLASAAARLVGLFRTVLPIGVARIVTPAAMQQAQEEIVRQTAAIRVGPPNVDLYVKRSMAFRRMNNPIRALADASEALRIDPKSAPAHLWRAALYLTMNDREQAVKDCDETIRLQPDCADAYTIRGMASISDRQQEKGVADLAAAARAAPKAFSVHFNLGLAHELGGKLDAAMVDYTEAIRLAPRDGDAFLRRGKAHAKKGEDAQAVKDFTEAVSFAPMLVRAYQQRAAAYRKLGNQAAAERDFDLADFFQREASRATMVQSPAGPIPQSPVGARAAAEAPPEVSLKAQRWQALPGSIAAVNVGPDGRPWYSAHTNRAGLFSVGTNIATIKSQFSRPAPVIADGRVALFEPGGRVWFYAHYSRALVGYDGKTWLARSLADDNEQLAGLCPTRGGLFAGDANRSGGGTAWFLGQRGVYRFDGADWHYQVLGDSMRYGDTGLLLAVAADGQTAVAVHRQPFSLWIYRRGRWQGRLIPELASAARRAARGNYGPNGPYMQPQQQSDVTSLALAADGTIWMLNRDGRCRRFTLEGDELQSPPSGLKFGSLSQLLQDDSGRIFIASQDISDGVAPFGPGMAIIGAGGKATLLLGADFERGLSDPQSMNRAQVVLTASGTGAWLPFRKTGEPPRLLDFEKKQFIDTLPRGNCQGLLAVTDDGRVFAGIGAGPTGHAPIMVYMPAGKSGPELQKDLEASVQFSRYAAEDNGAIWYVSATGALMRLDGPSPPKVMAENSFADLLPGRGGILLAVTLDHGSLYRGSELIGSGAISDLIEDHPTDFRSGFDPRPGPGRAGPSLNISLTADNAGNIWWRDAQRRLLVWDGSRWLNAHEALIAGGSQAGAADWIEPLGDGSKIYVCERETEPAFPHCFEGELRNGKLHFLPAPPSVFAGQRYDLRDPQGGLWIQAERRVGPNAFELPGSLRIDHTDKEDKVADTGQACGFDRSGSVWLSLRSLRANESESFLIWRNGKIVQKLQVPGYQRNDPLVSDRRGSVYIVTVAGLAHYLASAPDYLEYRLQAEYGLPDVSGAPRALFAAPPGYLTVVSGARAFGSECRLALFKLPRPASERPGDPQQH